MNRSRAGKSEGRGAPIEDPQVVRDVMRRLFEAETEFFIKVEGTSTLPYASQVQLLRLPEGQFVLKLVRPLPHEMPPGALFRMTFTVDDLRFEAVIALVGRDAYLQYGFQLPASLSQADRRQHPRYPFRPRENAYVLAQDGGIPGLGVAGPLVNISMGGVAMRVDRALRMEDGVRVPVHSALFERGKGFPRFRIQELPLLHLLEGRSVSAHASEHGTELVLGMSFNGMSLEAETALAQSLAFREKMYRGGVPPQPGGEARAGRGHGDAAEDPAQEPAPRPAERPPLEVTVLLRLRRRAARVVLVMADGPVRAGIQELLRQHGYHRLDTIAHMGLLRPLCDPGQRQALPALILADLALAHSGDAEPLAAVRILERQIAELGGPAAAILCEEVDPTLLLAQETPTRFLPYPADHGDRWVETLDGMLPA